MNEVGSGYCYADTNTLGTPVCFQSYEGGLGENAAAFLSLPLSFPFVRLILLLFILTLVVLF
jgi:hypothetical protein